MTTPTEDQPVGAPSRGKTKTTAGILGILLGSVGVHHFYLGSMGTAFIYLGITVIALVTGCFLLVPFCCLPITGIGALVEGILLLTMKDEEFDARYNDATPPAVDFVFIKKK